MGHYIFHHIICIFYPDLNVSLLVTRGKRTSILRKKLSKTTDVKYVLFFVVVVSLKTPQEKLTPENVRQHFGFAVKQRTLGNVPGENTPLALGRK